MSKFFDLKSIKVDALPVQTDKSRAAIQQFTAKHDIKVNNVDALLIGPPQHEDVYFLWTVNSFNAYTFIPWLISHHKVIDEIIISTYSINKKVIDSLTYFIDNMIVKYVFVLISDSANYRIPKVVDHLDQAANTHSNFFVRYAWNHSKVTLIRSGTNFYVLEGSGNFSENSKHEQYIMINPKKIFNFRKNWIMNEVFERTD